MNGDFPAWPRWPTRPEPLATPPSLGEAIKLERFFGIAIAAPRPEWVLLIHGEISGPLSAFCASPRMGMYFGVPGVYL